MKQKLLLFICSFLFTHAVFSQVLRASIGPGSKANSVKIYIKPSVTLADANISTLQFNLGIAETIAPQPTATVISNAFAATWSVTTSTEGGYFNFSITTDKTPINFATTADTEIEAMEVEFTGGPTDPKDVSLVTLPDGGSGGNALFLATSNNIHSDGGDLYYSRDAGVTVDNQFSYDYTGSSSGTGTSTATISGILLPVKWLSFTASLKNSSAVLDWTAEEKNNKYFEVMRSLDGTKFSPVAQVPSKGAGMQRYSFTDEGVVKQKSDGYIYYQIAQVDKDGKRSASPVRNVLVALQEGAFIVTPNPVRSSAVVKINHPKEEKVALRITDANGKILYQLSTVLQKGLNTRTINTGNLSMGNYSLSVIGGSGNRTIKLVKAQ